MAKKFTLMMLILLLFGAASYGFTSTASLGTRQAFPGDTVKLNLNVTNFNNIGSITFFISYDSTILSYIQTTDISSLFPGLMVNATGTSINIVWASGGSSYPSLSGLLLRLNFKFKGMTSTSLNFLGTCEVIQMPGFVPLTVTYTNGAVNLNPGDNTYPRVVLQGTSAKTGDIVPVPIQFGVPPGALFPNAGALTMKVQYDATKLTFVSITTLGSFSSVPPTSWSSNGVVTIAWTCNPASYPSGLPINYASNQLVLNFQYTGSTSTNIQFSPGCQISRIDGSNIDAVFQAPAVITYNGTAPCQAAFGAPIGTVQQGAEFKLPLNLTGFTAAGSNQAAAFTLNIPFDSPRLSYVGVVSIPAGVTVNVVNSTIQIVYVNSSPYDINGEFLRLRFVYNGVGTANVGFGSGCLFSRIDGSTIQVGYTASVITPAASTVNAYIGDTIHGVYPNVVEVPVYFTGLSSISMGATTLFIKFNTNDMDYVGIDSYLPGTVSNLVGNQINITWNSTSATNIDSTARYPFLNLKFQLKAGGATCLKSVTFNDGCELSQWGNGSIVPANWHNGGINLKWKISGALQYNNAPNSNLPISNAIIYIKDGAEPVPPAVSPIPNILYTTTTDANGLYSIYIPNGTYYIYASTTAAWAGVGPPDVTNLNRYIANLTPNSIAGNALRIRAADINQDGVVNAGDVTPLKRRISNLVPNPNYLAPNWLFQNPAILVNCANSANNIFLGICSGDVNGSYPNAYSK